LLPQILGVIAWTTLGTKYKILTCDTSDDNVKIFKSIAWTYGPCIAVFKHLRLVIIIDAGFLLGRYKDRLLMMCEYDAGNKLLPLAFRIVNKEKSLKNLKSCRTDVPRAYAKFKLSSFLL
jgi:hypothetical protein